MSIFTKIINRQLPAYFIWENENFASFLDVRPLTKGHTLVVPKKEVDYLFDVDERTYSELFEFARPIAIALKKAIPCSRIAIAVVGLEVPHAHLHLVPVKKESDLIFSNPRKSLSSEEFNIIAESIKTALQK